MTGLTEGSILGPLRIGPITRATLALFAGASGDHNPIHIDIDVARSAGLDDVFAHGMLSMAYLGRLLTDRFGQQRIRAFDARFTAVTPVGATVTCSGRVTTITEIGGTPAAVLDLTVTRDDGTVTLLGTATVDLTEELSIITENRR